jgi:hypothetical protein
MSTYLKISLLLAIIVLIQACADCPVTQSPQNECNVRDATITLFNPRLIKLNDTTLVPVPEYSIQTFQFPGDNSSSGSLPNDERFEKAQQIVVARQSFKGPNNEDLFAVIYDVYPLNSEIAGDIMVDSVTIDESSATGSTAWLRFYGTLGRFPKDFNSEDANAFCETYLKSFTSSDLDNIRKNSSQYGKSLPNSRMQTYSAVDIVVLDSKDKPVTGVTVPADVQVKLLSSVSSTAVDIIVRPGEVYLYKARNGSEFAVVIADIRRGTFPPYIKRVSIKFSKI